MIKESDPGEGAQGDERIGKGEQDTPQQEDTRPRKDAAQRDEQQDEPVNRHRSGHGERHLDGQDQRAGDGSHGRGARQPSGFPHTAVQAHFGEQGQVAQVAQQEHGHAQQEEGLALVQKEHVAGRPESQRGRQEDFFRAGPPLREEQQGRDGQQGHQQRLRTGREQGIAQIIGIEVHGHGRRKKAGHRCAQVLFIQRSHHEKWYFSASSARKSDQR